MIQLIKRVKKVEKDGQIKNYTNFVLRITMGNHWTEIPIQPVNFGDAKQNSKYYGLLSAAAESNNESSPF